MEKRRRCPREVAEDPGKICFVGARVQTKSGRKGTVTDHDPDDKDLEVKINRKFQDEQFRKRELRRKANNQLKDTDM